MSDMISRDAAASEFADWYGFNYQSQSYYKWLKSASTVNPITCDTLDYLETAYTGARACDDVAEQVRLARAIAAYKQDVHEDCTVLDKIRAEIEFEVDHRTNMLCAEDVFEIIDKYKASQTVAGSEDRR